MATLWEGSSSGSPVVYYTVTADTERNGKNIRIKFNVNARLGDYSYIYTGHTLNFYGGTYDGSTQASVQLMDTGDRWNPGHNEWYSTNWFEIDSTASSVTLYFFIEGGGFNVSQNIYGLSGTTDAPAYIRPTAPSWANISPNPCNINNKPIITWGGAQAGSSGMLLYDIEVRSTKSTGGWTDWLRIRNSYSGTSFNEIVLSGMSIFGQTPYVGVKYQYQIRSYDGVAGDAGLSGWTQTPELSVEFTLPVAPNVYWDAPTVKKNKSIKLNWNNATGGSGTITNYKVSISLMDANQTTVLSTYDSVQTGDSLTLNVLAQFPTARNGNYIRAIVYTNNSWGQTSYASNSAYTLVKGNQIWIKIDGTWREGECYIKIDGIWKEGLPYIKIDNNWKEST